jgi:hypothetical protein
MLLNFPAVTLDGSAHPEVLLVKYDAEVSLFRDEVLRHAGFRVTVLTTAETAIIGDNAFARYSVVVLCDTLASDELFTISARIRRNNPRAKIVLIEDADCYDFDPSLSDMTLDGYGGAKGLIEAVSKLTSVQI